MKSIRFGKKLLSLFLSLLYIVSFPAFASASDKQMSSDDKVLACNEAVFRFWDCFTNYESDEYSPPDYFGGFALNEEKKLIVYLTEDSDEIRSEIVEICKKPDISFKTVKYSFNYLKETMIRLDKIAGEKKLPVISMTLDLPNNAVSVILKNEDADQTEEIASVFACDQSIETDIFSFQIEPDKQTDPSEFENVYKKEEVAEPTRTTYDFYPGRQTSFGLNQIGTVGFCAYDSQGRFLMITHAHGYGFGSDDYDYSTPKSVSVAGLTMNAYTLSHYSNNDLTWDAAYIVIPNTVSYTVSNKVNNTSTRIQYIAFDEQLSSYCGSNASAYGSVGGFKSSTITVGFSAGYYYLSMQTTFDNGDSGGPIYMTSNSQNRLIGIIKSPSGDGVLWKNIRDRYYEKTGNTLVPYILDV